MVFGGFFARLKRGFSIALTSFGVLREHPSLLLFPLVSGVASILFLAALVGGVFLVGMPEQTAPQVAIAFAYYAGTTFIASFFNAGLVASARTHFRGEEPSVRGGLAAAWDHKGTLAVYALIAATVSLILRAIENADERVGRIVSWILGAAWTILTYFVVPVIVFEDVGPLEMFKRSGSLFRDTWGETIGIGAGVALMQLLLVLPGLLLAVALVVFVSSVGLLAGLAVGAAVIVLGFLAGTAMIAVAKTALYLYAEEGTVPSEFSEEQLSG
jgi:hypothetical protein